MALPLAEESKKAACPEDCIIQLGRCVSLYSLNISIQAGEPIATIKLWFKCTYK